MNDQFVLLLNKSYLNSGKPCNSGQFTADQTFHYIESTLYVICIICPKKEKNLKIPCTVYSLYSGKFGQP